jgi:predicted nucleic acid-binding protein
LSVYADTSLLVSLYVLDAKSQSAEELIRRAGAPPILLTRFGELELANAISLRVFRRELPSAKAKAVQALIREDLASGVLLISPLSFGVFERAIQISRRRSPQLGTRTLDVLHVASALELNASRFLTFDRRQEELARVEGFATARN